MDSSVGGIMNCSDGGDRVKRWQSRRTLSLRLGIGSIPETLLSHLSYWGSLTCSPSTNTGSASHFPAPNGCQTMSPSQPEHSWARELVSAVGILHRMGARRSVRSLLTTLTWR